MTPRPQDGLQPMLRSWLQRAQQHPDTGRFILRGSLVTRTLCGAGREVADVDYLALDPFDAGAARRWAGKVVATPDPTTELHIADSWIIWEETDVPGLRLVLSGRHEGGERLEFQIDVAYHDPLTQPPHRLDVLGVPGVRTCQAETLWAWKLHGITEHAQGRWRAKDLFDLYLLQTHLTLDQKALWTAVDVAFRSRSATLAELDDFLKRRSWGCSSASGRKWRTFERRYSVSAPFLTARDEVRAVTLALLEFPSS